MGKPNNTETGTVKLSDVIAVWDIIHVNNVGELGFCDLEHALDEVVGVENDCLVPQPSAVGAVQNA